MDDIWGQNRYRSQQDDSINEPVKFLVTVYATWAYTKMLQNLDAQPITYSQRLTSLYDEYETLSQWNVLFANARQHEKMSRIA